MVDDGRVDAFLVDARQVASDTDELDAADAEYIGRVVVRHGDFQVDRVVDGVRVGADQQTVVGRGVHRHDRRAVLEQRLSQWACRSLHTSAHQCSIDGTSSTLLK